MKFLRKLTMENALKYIFYIFCALFCILTLAMVFEIPVSKKEERIEEHITKNGKSCYILYSGKEVIAFTCD